MTVVSTTALDLITGALRNINALEAGETPNSQDANDALQVLNDMLESWSIEKLLVYSSTENILAISPGTYIYTIGNPVGGTFSGTLIQASNVISGVTVPSGLVLGGTVTDVQASLPAGTTITAIGTNSVTLSNNALFTVSSPEVFTYTTPGQWAIPLPVRITNAFTRITVAGGNPLQVGLDYGIRIINRDHYTALGLKGLPAPWATDLYYDRTYPLGTIYLYPNPSQGGQLHLWTDTLLLDFQTINAPINLPQGYTRAIKTNLAIELAAEYGKAVTPTLASRARESKMMLKSLNSLEAVVAFFDQHILKSRRADAGFIMHGGFYT